MLYCRPTFHHQFEFLHDKVLRKGTGKSATAIAFASTVDRSEWIVTWIHVSKTMKTWRCVRLIGDESLMG
ncbi:TPA: hypothetical protein N0F65_005486 [Lagenidium giganteum]|uniref:Uncharacterized protein n=1 Tax=Lagenidium giganteum TaxID=4803 RepID=A0AAV2YIS9_9STRA|nr:TPA: hypothetical protein N0F65_005486 [Lagenidium giganteum]